MDRETAKALANLKAHSVEEAISAYWIHQTVTLGRITKALVEVTAERDRWLQRMRALERRLADVERGLDPSYDDFREIVHERDGRC